MTTRDATLPSPKGSGDQVQDFQAVCRRVADNARAERAAVASRPPPPATSARAPAPRFATVKQVADFILGAGRGAKR